MSKLRKITRWSERHQGDGEWCVEITFNGVEYACQTPGSLSETREGIFKMITRNHNVDIPLPKQALLEGGFIYLLNNIEDWVDNPSEQQETTC